MRFCSRCKVEKPDSEFYKGDRRCCKPCQLRWNWKGNIKRLFGLEIEDYEQKLEAQGGVCEICGRVNQNGWKLSVDHDHDSGQVRDLLCMACNTALGQFQDSPEILGKAIKYLQKWGK